MKKNYSKVLLLCLASCLAVPAISQEAKKEDAKKATASPKVGGTSNVMLNASSDNGPRDVNIGLPKSVGGTVVLENGLPVTFDYNGQMPTNVWRQDNGVSRFKVLNVSETALLASDVGVSVSTWTNRGTEKFKGAATFTTNSFGLLRGDASVSGPIAKDLYYSLTAFLNYDPGTFRSNIATFMDQTQIFKGVINKKFANGQIGVQYKYAHSGNISSKQSPYIYHKNGKVDALPGFRIGRDSYLEQSGKIHAIDPLTGKNVTWDAIDDAASTSHVIDLMGDYKFDNGMVLDYTVRYHYANSGFYNPYLTSISKGVDASTNEADLKHGDKRYYYVDNPNAPYNGYVQNGLMIFSPQSEKNTVMARFELSKKTDKHQWMLGLHNWYYNADNVASATYNYQFEVSPNPKALAYDKWVTQDKNGKDVTPHWEKGTDENGTSSHNKSMQYYNGNENKLAVVAADKWNIFDKLSVDAGTRLEWQKVIGDWYPAANRKEAGTNWISGKTSDVNKSWWNFSVTASATYKAFNNFGFLADAYYLQQAGRLSSYAGADDPAIQKCEIPGFAGGVYFNHPLISLVSKVTKIKRTNFKNNSTFNKPNSAEIEKRTISYDVNTIGWTTDVVLTPFKGFDFHFLLTLQKPKYENYEFETSWGQKVNNNGNIARSVSKTIIEIDPSYSFNKFKVWASARYFSKEYANYPNTLTFAGRWETFAGINYKYDKNVEFALSAVNLLNQSGAQGSISGTNTTTSEEATALYDKPLSGTYIRPFTLEFKTKVKF